MNTKRRADCQLRHDWKERIIRIGDEQTSLQNQFDNFRNEYSDTHPRIEALEADVNALDGRLIIAESDIADAEDRIAECESDIDSLEAEVDALDGRVTITESDIAAAKNRISTCESDIESLETEVNSLDGRVSITESDIAAAKNRITACENDIDSLESEVNSLDGRVSITESDISAAEDRISACENDIESLETEVNALDGRVSITESDIVAAENRISTCESDIDSLESEVSSLNGRVSIAESDIAAAKNRITACENDIDSLESEVSSLDGRVSIAESDISDAEDRISACEADIDRIDGELVDKTGDINALANRISLAEADIDNLDARVSGIETGEILLSQLVPDADKDFEGKSIINPGLVDGVDVSEHTHDGTAVGGPKISYNNLIDKPQVDLATHTHDGTAVGGPKISYNDLVDKPDVAVATHTHDGTTVGGPKIDLKNVNITEDKSFNNTKITSLAGINDLVLSTTSVEEFIETTKDQLILTAGKDQSDPIGVVLRRSTLGPVLDNDGEIDLGRSSARFRDLYLSGDVKAASFNGASINTTKTAEWDGKARPPVPFYRDMISVFLGAAGSYSFGTRMGAIVPPGRIGCTPFTLWMEISGIRTPIDLRLEYVFDDDSIGRSDALPATEGQHHVELRHLLPTTDDYSTKNYIKDIRIRNLDTGSCTITASLKGFVY